MSKKVPEKSAANARNLALVSVAAAISLAASFYSDASEDLEERAGRHERWRVDRLAVLPAVFASVLCFYRWRRWREIGREADEREEAEEALRERVRESEQRLRAVITGTPVVLFVLDRGGVFTLSEGKGPEALGLGPGGVVGISVFEVYRESPRILECVRRALAGEDLGMITKVAGSTFETRYSPLRGKDGEISGVVGVANGTAERERAEEELREANRRLNELAVLKADFTAMVAHELGSPLAAIRRLAEMLDAAGETDRDAKAYAIGAISGELDTLDALVADVQASAAVERDDFRVELRPVPLGELLADARAFALTLPDGHPVNFVLDPDLGTRERVVADPDRIGQVLRNLLSNAAKYSPEGVPIELRAERKGDRVRIEVADHGPGLHPEDVVRIFEKFGRGRDREGKKIEGVGLGLYISRGIVRAHGGDFAVKSAPGEGAVFGFELRTTKEAL